MIYKRLSINKDKVMVIFELPNSMWVDTINLVGDFNNWDAQSLPFVPNQMGNWQVTVELDAEQEYAFSYLIDGKEWSCDWAADKQMPNVKGGYNSVVVASIQA